MEHRSSLRSVILLTSIASRIVGTCRLYLHKYFAPSLFAKMRIRNDVDKDRKRLEIVFLNRGGGSAQVSFNHISTHIRIRTKGDEDIAVRYSRARRIGRYHKER